MFNKACLIQPAGEIKSVTVYAVEVPQSFRATFCHQLCFDFAADVSLASVADTELTLSVNLNEASNVYFVVVPHPSVFPTTTEVSLYDSYAVGSCMHCYL